MLTSLKTYQEKLINVIVGELPAFKRIRNKLLENKGDFIRVIDVDFINVGNNQKVFTIYFGVHVPSIEKFLWNKTEKAAKISATACLFDCNINDVMNHFEGIPKIKYWDLTDEEGLFLEIATIIRTKLLPFIQKIDSLESLNDLVENLDFPTKNSATKPAMLVALKAILKKEDELRKLVKKLRDENYYGMSLIDHSLKENKIID